MFLEVLDNFNETWIIVIKEMSHDKVIPWSFRVIIIKLYSMFTIDKV